MLVPDETIKSEQVIIDLRVSRNTRTNVDAYIRVARTCCRAHAIQRRVNSKTNVERPFNSESETDFDYHRTTFDNLCRTFTYVHVRVRVDTAARI